MIPSFEIGKADKRGVFNRWWHNVCGESIKIASDEKAACVVALNKFTPWRRVANRVDVGNDDESHLGASERHACTPWIAEEAYSALGVGADEGEDNERPLVSL